MYKDEEKREMNLGHLRKWDDFRSKRKYFIEVYLALRRRQRRVDEIMRIIMTKMIMKHISYVYDNAKLIKI